MRFACRKPYFYVGGGKKNTWFKKYRKSPEANVLRGWHDRPVPCSVVLGFTCKHRKIVDLILSSYFQIISNSKRTCKNSVITFFFPEPRKKKRHPVTHPPNIVARYSFTATSFYAAIKIRTMTLLRHHHGICERRSRLAGSRIVCRTHVAVTSPQSSQ